MGEQLVRYHAPQASLMRFQPQTLQDIMAIANMFEASGMFPNDSGRTQTAAQIAVKILAGQELGLTPFAAANGMQIIKGKCTPSANVMAAKVKASGHYSYIVTKMTDAEVSIDFFEKGEKIGTSSFSEKDAQRAGTQNMGKFPRNMLFARAISNGVKWYCPDLFNGVAVYTPDEMGATVDYETGEIVSIGEGDPGNFTLADLPELNPDGDSPFEDAPPAKPVISKPDLNTLHALGAAYYGSEWDTKRPSLVETVTKGATKSSAELTPNEGQTLITGLEKRIRKEYGEIAQALGEPVDGIADLHGVKLAKALTELRARVMSSADESEKVAA